MAEPQATPRPTNKLCQLCFASIPEADLQAVDGKAVCPQCLGMMNKTAQTSEPQNAAPQAAAPRTANRQTAAGIKRPTPLPTQPAVQSPAKSSNGEIKFNRYQEEQLKKKLTWVKVVLVIAALCLLFTGGVTFFLGDLGEAAANSNSLEDQALAMMEEAGSTPEEIERSRKEEAEARQALRRAASAAKTIAMVQLAIAAAFIVMFFLTNTYPFEISLAALVLYVSLEVWSLVAEGPPGLIGCLIILVIIANLGMGVQAGWQIRKLRAESA